VTNKVPEFLAAYDALLARWPDGRRAVGVETPYGTTRVNVCGPDGGPPLVLFHGHGATSAVWSGVAGELGRARRVLAVDRPGEPGRSVQDGRQIRSAGDAMRWADAVFSGLGLTTFALCGHSYGAWLALSYALRAPERVRALALLDPTNCFAGFRAGYLLRGVPQLIRPGSARAAALLRWETAGVPVDQDWVRLATLGADVPAARPVRARRPARSRLRSLRVPTLVVLAERSRAHDIRRVAAAARAGVPGLRVEVLAGATHHSIPAAQAGPLSGLLAGFLQAQRADQ
jgi:pimeloyl-ACP methyl ester carboxylesterase